MCKKNLHRGNPIGKIGEMVSDGGCWGKCEIFVCLETIHFGRASRMPIRLLEGKTLTITDFWSRTPFGTPDASYRAKQKGRDF